MVTPFASDGSLDLPGAARLATHLVDAGCDGLVISGTTGESATTSDAEQLALLSTVLEAVGDRARITAGVGTNNTAHTLELARAAARAGAHGLLVVTPYYTKPPQHALVAHFTTVADATELPVLLYDIAGRTGVALTLETLTLVAQHPRIQGLKDASGDLARAGQILAETPLALYGGDDILTLPFLSIGAVGVVSVVAHLVAPRLGQLLDAYQRGDVAEAARLHQELLPVFTGIFRTQGVITAKAVLNLLGLPAGPVRPPLADATKDEIATLRDDLALAGIDLPTGDPA
jgi:4-hydroxy-tetrahydrodipicolinate synthase